MASDNEREIEYSADGQKLVSEVRQMTDRLADLEDQMIASGQSTKGLEKIVRDLDGLLNRVSKKLTTTASATKAGANAARDAAKEYQAYQKIQDQIANVRSADRSQNLSGLIDTGYAERQRASKDFSNQLRARLQGEADAQRASERTAAAAEKQAAREQAAAARTAAAKEQARAREAAAAARAAQAEEQRIAREEARLRADINKSGSRVTGAQDARAYREEANAIGDIAAARNRAERATRNLAAAQNALRDNTGDLRSQAAAWRNLADAEEEATRAARAYDQAHEDAIGGLATERYALYDVAGAYGAVGAAILGAGAYAVTTGARYESAFTRVEQVTTGTRDEIGLLRSDLIDLSTQIPLTFDEISSLAARGAQVGVAESQLARFTETMAQFIAISDGIDQNSVVETFGRLSSITGVTNFEALASAVAAVGRTTAATDQQILNTTNYIMGVASAAGFTADQIIGLSGAIISLGITQPQGARAGLQGFFRVIDNAIAGTNDKLPMYAQLLGKSADEVARLRRERPDELLIAVTSALQQRGTENLTANLSALGVTSNEVTAFFASMVSQLDKAGGETGQLTTALETAHSAFLEQTELQNRYAKTLDDLSTQWQIFVNNINAFIEVVTGGAVPGMAALLVMVNEVIRGFTEWLGDNQFAADALRFAGILITLVGAVAAVRAISALARGSMLAFALANAQAAAMGRGLTGTNFGLIASFLGVSQASINSARAMTFAGRAGILAAAALRKAFAVFVLIAGALGVNTLIDRLTPATTALNDLGSAATTAVPPMEDLGGAAGGAGDSLDDYGDSAGGAGGKTSDLAKEVRTLVEYASDLGKVFDRTYDLRFGGSSSQDNITKQWIDIAEAIDDATAAIEKHRASIAKLNAERNQQAYFGQVAAQYGDELRGAEIRADIAEIDAKLAEESKNVAEQQGKLNKGLTGSSKSAIENRSEILDLVGGYQDYVQQLAASGISQEELRRRVNQLKSEFIAQGVQLGYSREELNGYAQSFDDFIVIIDNVPRNVTVDFNANPAMQALAEFQAELAETQRAAENAAGGANDALSGIGGGGAGMGALDDYFAGLEEALYSGFDEIPYEEQAQGFWEKAAAAFSDGNLVGLVMDVIENMFNGDSFSQAVIKSVNKVKAKFEDAFGDGWFGDLLFKVFTPQGWIQIGMDVELWFNNNVVQPMIGASNALAFAINELDLGGFILDTITGKNPGPKIDEFVRNFESSYNSHMRNFVNLGSETGDSVASGFSGVTVNTDAWVDAEIINKVRGKNGVGKSVGAGLSSQTGSGFTGNGIGGVDSWTTSNLLNPVSNKGGDAWGRGRGLSGQAGSGFTSTGGVDSGGWTTRNLLDPVSNQGWAAETRGRSLGEKIVAGMRGGINSTFSTIGSLISTLLGNTTVSTKGVGDSRGKGWATGGYTGAGHWLEPAGIVHKGEHVVPKWGTDQRTGLPKEEYMASVRNGRSARSSGGGYAGGGYVGGGSSGAMMVVIDPRQVRQLAGSGQVYATLAETPEQVSGYGDRGRSTGARRGSQR